jgi:hypothetical protein
MGTLSRSVEISESRSGSDSSAAIARSYRAASHAPPRSPQPSSLPPPSCAKNAASPSCGRRRLGALHPDLLHVVAQHAVLDRPRAEHVEAEHQHLARAEPGGVLGDHGRQGRLRERLRCTLEEKRQHGHEVALARTERAVEIGRKRLPLLERRVDPPERVVHALDHRHGRHIVGKRRRSAGASVGQLDDEVLGAGRGRNVDQVLEQGHSISSSVDPRTVALAVSAVFRFLPAPPPPRVAFGSVQVVTASAVRPARWTDSRQTPR